MNHYPRMVEAGSAPHFLNKREPRLASQLNETSLDEGLHQWDQPTSAAAVTPSFSQDIEELETIQRYKRIMLDDAASSTSFGKGGARLPRATQAADAALADLESWMDRQPLRRTAQAPEKQKDLAKLTTQAKVAREAATSQRAAADRERNVQLQAKREADRAERDHHANAEILETLADEKAAHEALQESEVAKRVSIEADVAGKMEEHHRARAVQRGEARQQLHKKAQAQLQAAKAARRAAAERSNLLVRDAEPALKEVVRMKNEAHAQRVECVLQLKADTEAAAALIRGANERNAAEKLREEAAHEAEKEHLAAKGLNPYKVFKQRAVDARAVREEKRQETRILLRKEELADRLKKEEALRNKHDAKVRSDKDQEQRMRDELGRHVVDARNREYLRARTVDGTDILDPSGRSFRIEASQVTTIKDAAFGLGYHPRKTPAMAAAMVDLVASKPQHAGVGPGEFARLIPRDLTDAGRATGNEPSDQDVGGRRAAPNTTTGRNQPQHQPPQKQQQQQQQLLEDLVPPADRKSLPGTGIPFVVEGEEIGETDDLQLSKGRDATASGSGRGGGAGRNLSVLEARSLQKARAQQRDRVDVGEPQVAAGRTFKDRPSFVAKPDHVVFKDFVVGKVHRRRIVLTNVSLTFNTLKVLGMSDEVNRFFEVTYAKPGRLSAGMTCAVDIAFTPKVEEDIFTELPIRTQTGPLSIPVECTARRVKPKLSTALIVFQGTVVGEKETARVRISNEGVLNSRFTVKTGGSATSSTSTEALTSAAVGHPSGVPTAQHNGGRLDETSGDCEPTPVVRAAGTPVVDPRSDEKSREAVLLAKASAVGDAGMKYPEGRGAIEIMEESGELMGYGSAEIVIVFAPLTVGDFKVVKIRICNRGKIAMKAVARVPPSLRGCTSFSPDMGFVQPGSFFEFGLRFRPDPESLARCARDGWGILATSHSDNSSSDKDHPLSLEHNSTVAPGSEQQLLQQQGHRGSRKPGVVADGDAESSTEGSWDPCAKTADAGGIIAIPLRFDVPGQALPARAVLQARLTGSKVEVGCGDGERGEGEGGVGGSEAVVNFGPCFVGQSVTRRVSLRNTSLLPAKFGFIGNPAEVDLQPADGFGVLLPGEERWIEATFSPLSSVSHVSTVSFRTSLGQSTSVRCLGFGVDPVIKLSHTVLSLAPACSGDTVTASIFVNNVSAVEQNLEFCVPEPEISFLKICPSVIRLFPKEGARIEVSFCPPRVLPFAEALGAAEEKEGTTNEEKKHVEEQQIDAGAQKKGPGGKDAKTTEPNSKSPAAQAATQKAKGSSAPAANNDEELEQKLEGEDNANGAVAAVVDVVNTAHEVPLYAGAVDEGGSTNDDGGHEGGDEEEPWSRHGRWRVPCFLKTTRGHSAGGSTGDTAEACLPPLALEVTTVTVERTLSVDQSRVDFGQLAVGTKAEEIVRVRNAGDDDAPLEGGGLNSVGPFEVLNAFRTVPRRGGSHRCVLQFRPERAGIVSETLVLTSPSLGKSIRVCVRGEGVKPVLRMTPADGRLDMGHVLEGDTIEREVKLLNDSVFPLRYATAPFGPRPSSNVNHLEAFSLVPCEGGVPPGESVTVTAIFSPDYSRIWPFLGAFRIEARDQVYLEAAPPGQNPGDRTPEATEDALDPRNGLSNGGRGSTEDGRSLPASAGVQ
ncbi:conserved unknown protein [Ectocarpus siliculosus]|uniref:Flagellar associated protein n=1 Tax=Ectocarpus siliculosus TaxID=2880 RepID=D7G8B1_ECTSI|nr:conserved unknown protein [Ectocarpus siliculosus]|eukprot:CBJ27963.1 conserved unknown protein [Ectocarpus siliculosus]